MNFFQAVNLTSYRHIPALNHNILIIQKVLVFVWPRKDCCFLFCNLKSRPITTASWYNSTFFLNQSKDRQLNHFISIFWTFHHNIVQQVLANFWMVWAYVLKLSCGDFSEYTATKIWKASIHFAMLLMEFLLLCLKKKSVFLPPQSTDNYCR